MAIGEFPKWKTLFHLQKRVHLKFGYLKNEDCKFSEILIISLFAIFQLADTRIS